MPHHNYKELLVWQKARLLVKDIYVISAKFPSEERFGITSQIRRAVVSISNNISEGSGRGSDKDFSRFLDLSAGSAYEVENMSFLCFDLEYFGEEVLNDFLNRTQEIQKMIFGLQNKLNNNLNNPVNLDA